MYDHLVAALLIFGAPLLTALVIAVASAREKCRIAAAMVRHPAGGSSEYEQSPFTRRTLERGEDR